MVLKIRQGDGILRIKVLYTIDGGLIDPTE
jgi:hypothetical protein